MHYSLTRLLLGLALALGLAVSSLACRAQDQVNPPEKPQTPRAADAPADSLTFGDHLGVTTHFDRKVKPEYLDMLVDLGVKWVRDHEVWKEVETEPGRYAFSDAFKKRLAFYKKHDIGVCFGLWYANPVAYPDDPFSPEHYGQYAAAMARKLDEAGVDYTLEVWNEPHNFVLQKKFGGNANAAPPSPWADHYVKLVRAAVKAVKRVNPDATVITDEDYLVAHYWFLEQGLPKALDGFALHPYVHGPSPGPEKTSYGPDVDWAKGFTVIDQDQSFASMIRRVTQQYRDKLGHDPELWITEWGYRLGKHVSEDERITEDLAASFLPRLFILSVANGARCVMWHNFQDLGDGPYGLIRNDQTKRATYHAYQTMSRRLGDQQLLGQVNGVDTPTTGIQSYLFKGEMGYQMAAWAMSDGQKVAIDTNSSIPLKAYDKFGKPVQIRWQRDGLPVIDLGRSPVYITGVINDVKLLAVESVDAE